MVYLARIMDRSLTGDTFLNVVFYASDLVIATHFVRRIFGREAVASVETVDISLLPSDADTVG